MGIFHSKMIGWSAGLDAQGNRIGSRTYRVFATTDFDEQQTRAGLNFALYQPHPSDPGCVVINQKLDLGHEHKLIFDDDDDSENPFNGTECYMSIATIDYGPRPFNGYENPTDVPLAISLTSQPYEEDVDLALDDNNEPTVPSLNTAGVPFDPGNKRERNRRIIKLTRNESSYNAIELERLENSINLYEWNSYPPRTVKFSPPNMPQKVWSQFLQAFYWVVEYEFIVDWRTWDAFPLNLSYLELRNGKLETIRDEINVPLQSPGLLDENGAYIRDEITESNFYQPVFKIYPAIDFAIFNLGGIYD